MISPINNIQKNPTENPKKRFIIAEPINPIAR